MSLLLLGASLAVVAFAVASALFSVISALAFRTLRARLESVPPALRARWIFALRALPGSAALLLTAGVFVPSFLIFEPRDAVEPVGGRLMLLAGVALVGVARGPLGALRDAIRTGRLVREWIADSEPLELAGTPAPTRLVDSAFPVVAVFGVRRPTLLVARTVRDACTEGELAAVLGHESGHVRSGDNLKRLVLRAAPDLLAWTPAGARMERAWSDAIEEAADRQTPPELALALASALVKVARLAVDVRSLPTPASALYQRGPIDRRVRHLIGRVEPACPRALGPESLCLPAVAALALAVPLGLLPRVHAWTELVVAALQ